MNHLPQVQNMEHPKKTCSPKWIFLNIPIYRYWSIAICQTLQRVWQGYSFQALVETLIKCQGLETTWQFHSLQALIEIKAKCQALETLWQCHCLQALVKSWPKAKICRLLGRFTRCRLQLNLRPKLIFWRPLGRVEDSPAHLKVTHLRTWSQTHLRTGSRLTRTRSRLTCAQDT